MNNYERYLIKQKNQLVKVGFKGKIMIYLNVHKTISQSMKIIKSSIWGMIKYWLFWGVNLIIIALFLLITFFGFGHFILGH